MFLPSLRGFGVLFRARTQIPKLNVTRCYSEFLHRVSNPENKTQVYISRSQDPYLNLSVEHYLLQKTPEDSTILFLYTNRPCIVIGRNQNPWKEINLGSLRTHEKRWAAEIVRRRSGGGTVYHDEGNVNYSVICPTAVFHRDKHAEMVVRALLKLGVKDVKVNCRHDIVVDRTSETGEIKTFKVSGSAYKLTRLRSLHHGTCLLSTGNLQQISTNLKAPAKPFINARGVDSVSSPIQNVEVPNAAFEEAVVAEFNAIYNGSQPVMIDDSSKELPDITNGYEELKSEEWIYGQTPQFSFCSSGLSEDLPSDAPVKSVAFPPDFSMSFTARHGRFVEIDISCGSPMSAMKKHSLQEYFENRYIHDITDWEQVLNKFFSRTQGTEREHNRLIRESGHSLNVLFGGNPR